MPNSTQEPEKKASIAFRAIDPEKIGAELERRAKMVQVEIRQLEEAKVVSQKTMQREVSV